MVQLKPQIPRMNTDEGRPLGTLICADAEVSPCEPAWARLIGGADLGKGRARLRDVSVWISEDERR